MLRIPILNHIKDVVQGKTTIKHRRSSSWPIIRKRHLVDNPKCAACGGKKKLEVHHIVPFHINPDRELDPTNLITLCESKKRGINCHLFVGHLGNYKSVNSDSTKDANFVNSKIGVFNAEITEVMKAE